jgi:hypothetical protein
MEAQLYVPPLTLSLSPEYEGEGTGATRPGSEIYRALSVGQTTKPVIVPL